MRACIAVCIGHISTFTAHRLLGAGIESSPVWDFFCLINEVRMLQRATPVTKANKPVCLTDLTCEEKLNSILLFSKKLIGEGC